MLSIPVPVGEVIDKVTILDIKIRKLDLPAGHALQHERDLLIDILKAHIESSTGIVEDEIWLWRHKIEIVNEEIWDLQELIRPMMEPRSGDSGPLLDLCLRVIERNDMRAKLKRRVDVIAGSQLLEEKSFSLD